MILIIDNYDSFTYNLVQYFGELGEEMLVKRNDEITIAEIEQLNPDYLVISPGPCTPDEAGIYPKSHSSFRWKNTYSRCLPRSSGDCASVRWESGEGRTINAR